ncbi:hypothetical protein, conserved [Eimeria brunetti]|uniref:Uncharacterized protein n=1 Tax=Eimeria brunetti TaxID=51314 RepID=U6LSK2_9EIME|nr:hypothetical protein, conserved [Eimeria brunetti]
MLTAKLCKACENGNVEEVEELLDCGATPNFALSGNGYCYPLHYAATSGHAEVVKLLLQHGTAVDPLEASNGWTPLMIATLKSANSEKHIDVMMLLLEGGADAEVMDATKLLKRLLQKFPSLDVLGPGFGYLTPLHYAAEAGHVDTVDFLLHLLADPRCVDATGWTPLHWACRRGHKQVVDLLLRYGGSVEDRDFRSLTPLDVACLFNHTALAKLLDAKMPPGDKGDFSHSDCEPAANTSSEAAFKVFLISRRGLLFYLDCVTHASALLVNPTEGSTKKNGDMRTLRATKLPRNGIGRIKPVYEQRVDAATETAEKVHPSVSVSSPRFGRSPSSAQRTEPTVFNSPLEDARSNKTGDLEDKESQSQCQRDPKCGDRTFPLMRSAHYTSATYYGSVPQNLHPCPSLQWSIQLHRQHIEINRDRHFLVTHWKFRTGRPEIAGSSPSGVSYTVSAEERGPTEQRQFVQGQAGWSLHERRCRLFADSLRAQVYAQDSDGSSVACDGTEGTYLPSGLEQESTNSPRASNKAPAMLNSLDKPTQNPWFHGILAFVYGSQVHEAQVELQAVADGNSAAGSFENTFPKDATTARCNDSMGLKIDTSASVLQGASPYTWVPRKLNQQHTAPVQASPPTSPFSSRAAPESPPEISGSRVPDGENSNFPLDSDIGLTRPSADLDDRALRRGVKLIFTGAHPGLCLTSAESAEDQEKHGQVLSGTRGLENRKRRPFQPDIDDARYDSMVIQRERCIFNWFERLVAFRFAELTDMSKAAEAKIDGVTSDAELCSSGGNTEEIRSPLFNLPSSADPADTGIKWDTFGTLFPHTQPTTQVDCERGEPEASSLEEEKRVTCLCTEDLFDLPMKEPVVADARQHLCGKGRREQRGLDLYRNKIEKLCMDLPVSFNWSTVAIPGTSGGGSSTRGDSGSDQHDIPILHYRFKDMMELPHLREHPATREAEVAEADEGMATGQIRVYRGPPEPPISCAVAVSVGESE